MVWEKLENEEEKNDLILVYFYLSLFVTSDVISSFFSLQLTVYNSSVFYDRLKLVKER